LLCLANPSDACALASVTGAALYDSGTRDQSCLPLPTMRMDLLVAVGVFLSAHVAIVLHVAFVKILADVIVILNVIGS
jgi:hypothetical protein